VACQNNHVNNVEIVYFALLIASNITVLFEIKSYVCMCKWVFENATGNRQKQKYRRTGTDVVILKLFSPKNLAKILAFFAQTTVTFCKKLSITLVFEINAVFFAENLQKSLKIVIITSTPGRENNQ
jgi:hypothetical protein